ncbi:MAG: o-succinylbenzoate synthase [Myxococcota bacterium]
MKLSLRKVQLYGYVLPLCRPLTTQIAREGSANRGPAGASPEGVRRGLLVALYDEKGRVGWGDIAPLPGLHDECLRQAKQQAKHLLTQLLRCDQVICHTTFSKGIFEICKEPMAPSVRWGVETALVHVQRLQRPESIGQHTTLTLNALVPPGDCSQMISHARKLLLAECTCLKLKVGHLLPLQAADLVRHMYVLCKTYGASMRLDMGGRWSLQQAVQFGRCIRPHWVEYVEEPVMNPQCIPRLHACTGLSCALDDTLHRLPAGVWTKLRGVCAWVVKPSLLAGGLRQWHGLLREARRCRVSVVLSSCFESGLGLRHIACLARDFRHAPTAAGLLTSCWFAADVMPLMAAPKSGPTIHLPTIIQQLDRFDPRRAVMCRLLWQQF